MKHRSRWLGALMGAACLLSALPVQAAPAPLTWRPLFDQPSDRYKDLCAGRNGLYIAVGRDGMVGLSQDGRGWERIRTGTQADLSYLNCAGPTYVAQAFEWGAGARLAYSADGRTWRLSTWSSTSTLKQGILYGNNRWIALFSDNQLVRSTDGVTWAPITTNLPGPILHMAFGGGRFTAVVGDRLYTSTDAVTWRLISGPTSVADVTWGNGNWLAAVHMSVNSTTLTTLLTSADGLTWRSARTVTLGQYRGIQTESLTNVIYRNGQFIASGSSRHGMYTGEVPTSYTSTNLVDWYGDSPYVNIPAPYLALKEGQLFLEGGYPSLRLDGSGRSSRQSGPLVTDDLFQSVTFADGKWVALTSEGYLLQSADGERWSDPQSSGLTSLAYGNGLWVGTTIWGVRTSTDLVNWKITNNLQVGPNVRLAFGGGAFILGWEDSPLYRSTDGVNWAPVQTMPDGSYLQDLVWLEDHFLALNNRGTYRSTDGQTWSELALPGGVPANRAVRGGGQTLLASGQNLLLSTDETNWEVLPTPLGANSLDRLVWAGDRFVAITWAWNPYEARSLVAESPDGRTWQPYTLTNRTVKSLSFAGDKLFVGDAAGGLFTTLTGAPCGAPYKDLSPQLGSCDAVRNLTGKAIITGLPDGTFRPAGTLDRASFAKMVTLALGEAPDPAGTLPYKDTANHWAAQMGYLQTATRLGLIIGMPDGRFDPDGLITRSAAVKIITAAAGIQPEPVSGQPWYYPWFDKAERAHLLDPLTRLYWWSVYHDPDRPVTRGEAAVLIDYFLRR